MSEITTKTILNNFKNQCFIKVEYEKLRLVVTRPTTAVKTSPSDSDKRVSQFCTVKITKENKFEFFIFSPKRCFGTCWNYFRRDFG